MPNEAWGSGHVHRVRGVPHGPSAKGPARLRYVIYPATANPVYDRQAHLKPPHSPAFAHTRRIRGFLFFRFSFKNMFFKEAVQTHLLFHAYRQINFQLKTPSSERKSYLYGCPLGGKVL